MTKRTQLFRRLPDDLFQADRVQPPQCFQEHRTDDRGRQAAFPLQCHPPWTHGRDGDRCARGCRDYKAFEAAISTDYNAQSAIERELVLRLASLLWRLRRASTIETGLFEIQADHLTELRRERRVTPDTQQILYAMFGQPCSVDAGTSHWPTTSDPKSTGLASNHTVDFARCFLRLANLPNFAFDRLARYEATLWRQAGQILFALDALDRRKPQKPGRRFHIANRQDLQADGREGC
jgi:hypothetical protein